MFINDKKFTNCLLCLIAPWMDAHLIDGGI